jgi:hypothetical protein
MEDTMAQGDDLKALQQRIDKLESMLAQTTKSREATNLTADEIKAYQKVRDVMAADYGEFCGINDCFRCIIQRCYRCYTPVPIPIPRVCDVECSCGPCNVGGLGGGLGRFSGLGG